MACSPLHTSCQVLLLLSNCTGSIKGWERLSLSSPLLLPLQEEVRSDDETRAAATRVLAQLADGCSPETCEAELLPRILRRAEDSAFQVRQVSLLWCPTYELPLASIVASTLEAWCEGAVGAYVLLTYGISRLKDMAGDSMHPAGAPLCLLPMVTCLNAELRVGRVCHAAGQAF